MTEIDKKIKALKLRKTEIEEKISQDEKTLNDLVKQYIAQKFNESE